MPLYCENCMKLVEGPICPACRNRKLREVEPGDFCLVAEVPYMQAEMLKDVFSDNGVPFTERSVLGAALAVELGVNFGRVRLYVPFERFAEAKELYDAFFSGSAVLIPDAEENPIPERKLLIGHVYRHFKGGLYRVEDVAKHSETLEEYVVYRKLYGDRSLWIRPMGMFLSPVDREKYPDAMQEFRFEPVEDPDGETPESDW